MRNVARRAWRELRRGGFVTVTAWVRQAGIGDGRDRRECEQWALAIDTGRRHGVPRNSPMMEVCFRRLQGVMLAAEAGNWDLCTAVESVSHSKRLISREQYRAVLKEATAARAVNGRARAAATTGGGAKGPGA